MQCYNQEVAATCCVVLLKSFVLNISKAESNQQ